MAAVAAALGATGATAGPADVEADCEELQAALDNAQPGQVITLNEDCSETDDEIDLPFELPSRDSGEGAYTLQGSEEDAGISIDGEGDDRLITGTNTRPVVIRNLTFQNGRACQQPEEGDPPCEVPDDGHGGAIFVSGDSPLTIGDGDRFIDNEADGDGGAVHIDQSGAAEVLVYDNDFGGDEDGNVAGGSGGALYVESDAPVTVGDDPNDDTAGNLFDANEATHGGGVSVVDQTAEVRGADEGGLVTLENSTYTDNLANSSGGGAQVDMENAPVSVSGNDFGAEEAGNLAGFGGGGASINTPHSVDVVDNGFTGNVGLLRGGGLDVGARDGAAPNLTGNDFIENLSFGSGGGARVSTCDGGSLDGNTFEGNFLAFLLGIPGGEGRLERGKPPPLPQFGAGLEATLGDCNPNEAPWVQTDNRFRENVIIADFFGGSAAAGGGEFVRQLRLQSTNDRFVGNTVEAASEEDTAGGGLALDLGFQGAATVRNLVAAGNRVVLPAAEERGNGEEPAGRGGGVALFGEGSDADLEVLDSTVEGNVAREGSGIGAAPEDEPVERTALPTDRLILHNSIVFDNTGHEDDPEDGSDGEVFGFPERDVRFSDLCVDGASHDDGDGSDPNSNICTDPLLDGPVGDEDVDQTSSSPTIDAGFNELVPDDLGEDYASDPRITDGNRDGTATVDMGADEFPGPIPA
ncbi:MAG TPA: hypothetical protein VHG69_04900, partial [Thermoleophilaceae bacterium]|nr:hypothetical protein [Thermoleophilaceae bacterium]